MARSFTFTSKSIAHAVSTPAEIAVAYDPKTDPLPTRYKFNAIGDTGATGSVISKKVVEVCGLKPVGMVEVHTAGGICNSEVYLVSVALPNEVCFSVVRATKAAFLSPGLDVLIGMDIITQGDFALTHFQGKTCFSFRVPSCEKIVFNNAPEGGDAKQP
jgi:hypothetical protein